MYNHINALDSVGEISHYQICDNDIFQHAILNVFLKGREFKNVFSLGRRSNSTANFVTFLKECEGDL